MSPYRPPEVSFESLAPLFEYDRSAPLELITLRHEQREGVEISEVRYANGTGGEAAALLVVPEGVAGGQLPGVVYAHGGSAAGKHVLLGEAVELGRRGIAVLLPDAVFPPFGEAVSDERAIVTAIIAKRRGLDVLVSVCHTTRLGYFGHSAGGTQGAILSAVEPRLDGIVIAGTGSGLTGWAMQQGLSDRGYLDALNRFDPVNFVHVAGRRRILLQHGRHDESVTRGAAEALYRAAAEPKFWTEYDCGHGVDGHAPAREDRFAFFEELGKREQERAPSLVDRLRND